MTIDLIEDRTSRRQRRFQAAKVRAAVGNRLSNRITDIIVLFGGWGQSEAGEPLGSNESGTGQLITKIRELGAASPNTVIVRAYQGTLAGEGPRGEEETLELIRQQMHPLGKLIIHGYSAGGFSAMRVCYRLGMSRPYFVMQWRKDQLRRGLLNHPHLTSQGKVPANSLVGFVRVDSLTIVDAAAGPASSFTQRRAWPSVRRCLNFYQSNPSGIYSHGAAMEAFDRSVTTVENRDMTDRYKDKPQEGHGSMDEDTMNAVLARIRSELHS